MYSCRRFCVACLREKVLIAWTIDSLFLPRHSPKIARRGRGSELKVNPGKTDVLFILSFIYILLSQEVLS